jgi:hypothetical protein
MLISAFEFPLDFLIPKAHKQVSNIAKIISQEHQLSNGFQILLTILLLIIFDQLTNSKWDIKG